MNTLYVTSTATFSGKTALCIGLGNRFRRDGFSIGYMKPVSTTARKVAGRVVDEDAQFIKQAFDLAEPLEALAPIVLMPKMVEGILMGEERTDFVARLMDAHATVAQGKDVVFLEGGAHCMEGSLVGLSTPLVADLLQAQELVVIKYTSDLVVDDHDRNRHQRRAAPTDALCPGDGQALSGGAGRQGLRHLAPGEAANVHQRGSTGRLSEGRNRLCS